MKKILILIAGLFSILPVFASEDSAGVERYAIFIGSNEGGKDNQRLMYAGTDAMAFRKTMSEIGGIASSNAILLLDPGKDDLDFAMQAISNKIRTHKENTRRSEFLFYYSGHSDETALLLGKEKYGYSELKAAITSVPSDVHVVILDSCFSGNFIRTKGGQKKKPFLLDDSSVVKGHAYLSSSSSQESSQESDEIGSSFFTNAMLTGLRGAADSSGDKKVTLNELYSYAFSETLSKTENSSAGPQHPNYNITLVGSGDLVLSDISNSDSVVMLAPDLNGRVILRDKNGKLISEVNKTGDKPVYLALEKGDYSATLIAKNVTMHGSFSLKSGKVYELNSNSLSPVASSFNRLRGGDSSEEPADSKSEDEDEDDGHDIKFLSAPENLTDEDIYIPVEFSLVNNEISSQYNKRVFTTVSFGLVRSKVYEVDGIMLAFGVNEAENVKGVQSSYICNSAGMLRGAQASGIFNRAEKVTGFQGAGIFNAAKDFKGFQGAGIFNNAHDFTGFQGAGIFNVSHDFYGFQGAGIFNSARNLKGMQVAGIASVARELEGTQVSGIYNYADTLHKTGVQIGVVNFAKESYGLQFGLLNFSKNGIIELGMSLTTNGNVRFTLDSGNKRLYTVLGVSGRADDFFTKKTQEEAENAVAVFIAGLGTRFTYGMFNFDIEGLANTVVYKKDEAEIAALKAKASDEEDVIEVESSCFPSLRLSAGCTPAKHLNVFAAAMFSFEVDENHKAFKKLDSNLSFDGDDMIIHTEFEAGIRFSFN